jgi:F-type H+-transporting ATPase subunit delta
MREQDIPTLQTYAEALMDAARRGDGLDAVLAEAVALAELLAQNKKILYFLERPAIRKDEKKELIERVFKGKLSPLMLNLPRLLVDKNRGGLWDEILAHFVRKVEESKGIHPGKVSTAVPLNDAEKKALEAALRKFTGHKLRVAYEVDPRLVGGVLFRSGDMLIDQSVSRRTRELRDRLLKVRAPSGDTPTHSKVEEEDNTP